MNNFGDFDFFRVGAWMSDGLIISVSDSVSAAKQAMAKVALVAAVAVGGMSATITQVHAEPGGIAVSSMVKQGPGAGARFEDSLEQEIASMTADIDAQLDELLNLSLDGFDPETVELAGLALEAVGAREDEDLENWARRMVNI